MSEMSQSPSQPELLSMHGVCITVSTKRGTAQAVRGVDLGVSCGETLAIVGESGSGEIQVFGPSSACVFRSVSPRRNDTSRL